MESLFSPTPKRGNVRLSPSLSVDPNQLPLSLESTRAGPIAMATIKRARRTDDQSLGIKEDLGG